MLAPPTDVIYTWSGVMVERWGEEQYVAFMRGFFEILKKLAGQAVDTPELRGQVEVGKLRTRIFTVMCRRLMSTSCQRMLRRGLLWQLLWLSTRAGKVRQSASRDTHLEYVRF
jgi:hypothetical protein